MVLTSHSADPPYPAMEARRNAGAFASPLATGGARYSRTAKVAPREFVGLDEGEVRPAAAAVSRIDH